ncbi:hypothetical protein MXB_1445, partial [Myxobolus squamalis]
MDMIKMKSQIRSPSDYIIDVTINNLITQAEFLNSFGFTEQAQILENNAEDKEKESIQKSIQLLTSPTQMGT